jgi:hypothetical protein
MPHARIPLPDVYESVIRRVAVDVTAQLARVMNLPEETQVFLPGNTDVVPMNGGTFGECCVNPVKMSSTERLKVTYREEADESFTLTTNVNNKEMPPLFIDRNLGIDVRQIDRFVTLTATFEYTAPSIVIAQRWIDDMRNRISIGGAELYQTLHYNYAIPKPLMVLLKALYETQERSAWPTGATYEEWIAARFTVPTTVLATLGNTDQTLAVPQHQEEVLGWFDFTSTPEEPVKDSEGTGTYTTSFSYQLRYGRPNQVYVRFPMLVHQRPIPRLFRDKEPYQTYMAKTRKVSTTKGSFDRMMALMRANVLPYVHYPNTDDFVTDRIPAGRLTFFTGLMMLKPDDLRSVCDLSNLGEYRFNPYFLEYFYHMGDKLFRQDQSIIEFRLYENETLRSDIPLTIMPGTVRVVAKVDLDPTKVYHVQISLIRNWMTLTRDTLQCLRRYPHVLYHTLKALNVNLGGADVYGNLKLLGKDNPRPYSPVCPGEGWTVGPYVPDHPIGGPGHGGVVVPGQPWTNLDKPTRETFDNSGVVKIIDIDKAVKDTDGVARSGWRAAPLTVMYLGIVTYIHKEA